MFERQSENPSFSQISVRNVIVSRASFSGTPSSRPSNLSDQEGGVSDVAHAAAREPVTPMQGGL